jgi:four helix bundle protein
MAHFQFEKLRVHKEALILVVLIDALTSKFERRRYYLADQIRRAALSVILNIAEAAEDYSSAEKARIFGLARRSVGEVVCGLQVAIALKLIEPDELVGPIDQSSKVNGMLTRIILHHRGQAPQRPRKRTSSKPSSQSDKIDP